MKIGVIADDFTGASDIALTLAERGMPTAQFIGVPVGDAGAELGAGVVALKSRTAPVAEAVETSLAACDWLVAQGAEQIVLKVCSTFDSTAEGNIGPVLDALADRLGAGAVMVCPAFPENGRSVYNGHLFVNDKLISESGMQDHPLTPMRDSDLRRVLAAQCVRAVGHIPISNVMAGVDAICGALEGEKHFITDAIRDADLMAIGRAAKGQVLLCGGSGIALGLPANFGFSAARPAWQPVTGPGVVLSGSCSIATRQQVARFARDHATQELIVEDILNGTANVGQTAGWVLAQDEAPMIYTSADPAEVRQIQEQFGRAETAQAIEGFFAQLAAALAARGVMRIVVAGGETSGAVVLGLQSKRLTIGPRVAAGVPLVRTEAGQALALKSGNFGGPDFFAQALAMMEDTA